MESEKRESFAVRVIFMKMRELSEHSQTNYEIKMSENFNRYYGVIL